MNYLTHFQMVVIALWWFSKAVQCHSSLVKLSLRLHSSIHSSREDSMKLSNLFCAFRSIFTDFYFQERFQKEELLLDSLLVLNVLWYTLQFPDVPIPRLYQDSSWLRLSCCFAYRHLYPLLFVPSSFQAPWFASTSSSLAAVLEFWKCHLSGLKNWQAILFCILFR